jgi:hypothetical protein
MFKVGDFVEFIYGKHGAQIKRRGIYAEEGSHGFDKVIHNDKVYWVNPDHITAISMVRKGPVSEPVDN